MTEKLYSKISQKFKLILQVQKKKYERKGLLNSLVGLVFLFLFIYMGRQIGMRIWPDHISNKKWFLFNTALPIHYAAEALMILFYLPGYLNWLPQYKRYAVNQTSKWPWERPSWKMMRKELFKNNFINQLIILPIFVWFSTLVEIQQRFEGFPSLGQFCIHLTFIYYVDDFAFYWGHRLFHQIGPLYKTHKIHHEYDKIFTVAAEYIHPIDYIFGNMLPSALGVLLIGSRAHMFTYLFWIACKIIISSQAHSGFEFPWSPTTVLPLAIGPSFHDFHHSNNVGNYAVSCYTWDVLLGTGQPFIAEYLKEDKVQEKSDKGHTN